MPTTYYIGGRQYTRDELNAKRKVGSLDSGSLNTVSVKRFIVDDRASLVTDIQMKLADNNIMPSDKVIKFITDEETPVAELKAFLNDETNFFNISKDPIDEEEITPRKTRGRQKAEKSLDNVSEVVDNDTSTSTDQ